MFKLQQGRVGRGGTCILMESKLCWNIRSLQKTECSYLG
jgi:hypothetical protein